MRSLGWGWLLSILVLCAGCRSTYYNLWETVGVYKRDLLKKKVVAARDGQEEASTEFKDALTRLKELTGFDGGNLEKMYRKLQSDYDQADLKVKDVHTRIGEMESVAKDLFKEWEREIGQISSSELKAKSRSQLRETQSRYQEVYRSLTRAEQSMQPVLTRLRDQVLYLKHNLNAQALDAFKGESVKIQGDISGLINEMNAAIRDADAFINAL